jgi:hypothetical protein
LGKCFVPLRSSIDWTRIIVGVIFSIITSLVCFVFCCLCDCACSWSRRNESLWIDGEGDKYLLYLYYYIKKLASCSSSSAKPRPQAGTVGHNVGHETLSKTPYLVFRKIAAHPPENGSEVAKVRYRFITPYTVCRRSVCVAQGIRR